MNHTWPQPARRPHLRPRKVVGLTVALLVGLGAIVALIQSGSSDDAGSGDAASTASAPGAEPSMEMEAEDSAAGGMSATTIADMAGASAGADQLASADTNDAVGSAVAQPAPPLGQAPPPEVPEGTSRVVKNAELRVEVEEEGFTEAIARASGVATANGGFVVSSTTASFEAGRASGDLTLRVPAANFDAARSALAELGTLESEQVSGEDVTAQLVDKEARLRSLRVEEDALNLLVGEATNIGEILTVRQQLAGVRLSIEQLAAQQATLDDAATFSTLRVSLFEPTAPAADPRAAGDPTPAEDSGLARNVTRAVDAAEAVLGGMIVVLGVAAPFLALSLMGWAAYRLARRLRPAVTTVGS